MAKLIFESDKNGYTVKSPIELKGQGIKYFGKNKETLLYTVTFKAMDKLKKEHNCIYNC